MDIMDMMEPKYIAIMGIIGILFIVLIIFLVYYFYHRINRKISSMFLGKKSTQLRFLKSIAKALFKISFIVFIMSQLGFEVRSLLTFLGAAGISLSIAFRENLENLSSGVSMVVSKKVKVGEIVEVEGINQSQEELGRWWCGLYSPESDHVENKKKDLRTLPT